MNFFLEPNIIQKMPLIFSPLMFNDTAVRKHILFGSNKNVVGQMKSLCSFPILLTPISVRPPLLALGRGWFCNESISRVCDLEKMR